MTALPSREPALLGVGAFQAGTVAPAAAPVPDFQNIPACLRILPRWVRWRYQLKPGTTKPTKVPLTVGGSAASTIDPKTWSSFSDAVRSTCGDGIGFVFVAEDGLVGIDLDSAVSETGEVEPWAADIISAFRGTYIEQSVSGKGFHLIALGGLNSSHHKKAWPPGNTSGSAVEVYSERRFFCFTGAALVPCASVEPCQGAIDQLQADIFGLPAVPRERKQPALPLDLNDEELLRRARGSRTDFAALYDRGDLSQYKGDDSAGDMALANHLAFWTGRDYGRMDRLFRNSALMRPKFDEPHFAGGETYGAHTLNKAIRDCPDTYEPGRRTGPLIGADSLPEPVNAPASDGVAPHGVNGKAEGLTKAQTLISLANAASFFRTDDREIFASFSLNGHTETWPVKSMAFRDWLVRSYYRSNQGRPPGGQAMQDALSVIEANARIDAPKRNVFLRVGEYEGHIYVDLADDQWRAIKVTPDGWRVVPNPPVLFRRTKGMLPLPVPEPGGSLNELRPLLNADDETFVLIVSAMVGWLRPRGPYPLLIIEGEQGSAKTATARILRSFVDPSMVPVRKLPHDDADLAIAAKNTWLLAYDNLSGMSSVFSDVFCQIATGSGFARRELYTDSEEALFNFRRPVILNGIDEICTKPDLIDRSLIVNLPAIPPEKRRPEEEIQQELARISPRVFGALLDAISMALRQAASVRLRELPRMADFAVWLAAAEPALPWAPGTFMGLYLKSRGEATAVAMESDPLALEIQKLIEKSTDGKWVGSARQLLAALPGGNRKLPKSANALSGRLKRCAPLLREVAGIEVDRTRGRDRSRLITLRGRSVADLKTSTERSTGTSSGFFCLDVTDNKDQSLRPGDVADRNDDSPYSSRSLFFCDQKEKIEETEESRKDGENIDLISHIAQSIDKSIDSECTIPKYDLPQEPKDLPPIGICPSCGWQIFWRRRGSSDPIACERCFPPPPVGQVDIEYVAPSLLEPAA